MVRNHRTPRWFLLLFSKSAFQHRQQGELKEAEACYNRAVALNKENYKSYCNRGYLVRWRGRAAKWSRPWL